MGRYEVTNAEWKRYLDENFRVLHTTSGEETLEDIARRYVKFRSGGVASEWRAVYGLNAVRIRDALVDADAAAAEAARAANVEIPAARWRTRWTLSDPDPDRSGDLGRVVLPAGIELMLYAHRTPTHWFGWNRVSRLRVGKEYCDIRKPAEEAFRVPSYGPFREAELRDDDFARCPVRDLSANEMLAFAEWMGCHLPSEYEWERAARGDRPNTEQHTFDGPWDHRARPDVFAWADNPACTRGPLPVDDEVGRDGESPFGMRHMLGNVWEMTRTFFDYHPHVSPKPPEPDGGLFNFALTVKGGSWGDPWIFMQISARTGSFNATDVFDLAEDNRADSLGLRLVRHPRPGHDLLLHSILRLTYDRERGSWHRRVLPHSFALPRMAGLDSVWLEERGGELRVPLRRAMAIVFAPLWVCGMDHEYLEVTGRRWSEGEPDPRSFVILGVLRSDLPLHAGVRGTPDDVRVDTYAILTESNRKTTGNWREGVVPPGEWLVVYWNGFLGLTDRELSMPPEAILALDREGGARLPFPVRIKGAAEAAMLVPDWRRDRLHLRFRVEEQPVVGKPRVPPDQEKSEHWALCEIHPNGWPGRVAALHCWEFRVTLIAEGLARAGFIVQPSGR
jgi:formylglycine-generating enzyme required for sulfatase activity